MLFTQKQYEFNQIVDHFNYQNTSYFKQRYWVIDEFFNPKVGPVFLFICG
jgi:dipeptidase